MSNDTMIIIHLPHTDNTTAHISQAEYNEYTTYEKLDSYFKNTRFENYTFHGSYERHIVDDEGNTVPLIVTRIRITTVDEAGDTHIETHAILFSSMIPYLKYSVSDVINIVSDHIPDSLPVSEKVRSSLKRHFKSASFSTVYSIVQNVYTFIRLFFISTQSAMSFPFTGVTMSSKGKDFRFI